MSAKRKPLAAISTLHETHRSLIRAQSCSLPLRFRALSRVLNSFATARPRSSRFVIDSRRETINAAAITTRSHDLLEEKTAASRTVARHSGKNIRLRYECLICQSRFAAIISCVSFEGLLVNAASQCYSKRFFSWRNTRVRLCAYVDK